MGNCSGYCGCADQQPITTKQEVLAEAVKLNQAQA